MQVENMKVMAGDCSCGNRTKLRDGTDRESWAQTAEICQRLDDGRTTELSTIAIFLTGGLTIGIAISAVVIFLLAVFPL